MSPRVSVWSVGGSVVVSFPAGLADIGEDKTDRTSGTFQAGEFTSKQFKTFMEDQGVHLYFTNSVKHSPQAERLIRTMRTALRRWRTSNNTDRWVKALPQLMKNYNNSVTRVHKLTPMEVFTQPKAALQAYANRYYPKPKARKSGKKKKKVTTTKLLPKDTYVRLSRIRGPFEKESSEKGTVQYSMVSFFLLLEDRKYVMCPVLFQVSSPERFTRLSGSGGRG